MASVYDWIAQSRAAMEASKNAALGGANKTTAQTSPMSARTGANTTSASWSNTDYSRSNPKAGATGIVAQTSKTTNSAVPAAWQQAANNVPTKTATAATATPTAAATPTTTAAPAAATLAVETPTTATTAPTAATETPATTTTKSTSRTETLRSTPTTYTPTGLYDQNNLDAYNKQREADLQALYAAALQNTQAGLKTAYDQNMSDAEAARDRISPQYQQSMNAMSAEYERQRRNNNMQAAMNGLNTGAGSQMALAQSANYQANQAGLAAKENEALNEANRRILDLQNNYQNAIAEAAANNNYKLAAAMLDEYQNAYNRQMNLENTNYQRSLQNEQQNYTRQWNEEEREYSRGMDEAAQKAQYGDFSGYNDVYGSDVAKGMEAAWALQNPQLAWASGRISSADYYALTGRIPNDPNSVASRLPGGGGTYGGVTPTAASSGTGSSGGYSGGSGYGSLRGLDPSMGASWQDYLKSNGNSSGSGARSYSSGGYSSGGGYSSSRDRGYNGPPGYYDTAGNFIVPNADGSVNYTYSGGSKMDQAGIGARDQNAYQTAKNYAENNGTSSTNNSGGGNNTPTTFEEATQDKNDSENSGKDWWPFW